MDGLPTPPNEEAVKTQGQKRSHHSSKPVKTVHRTLKRTGTHGHPPSPVDSHSQHSDGRHKRVWKACERCRMKKTKCDGEFPCKRCKDDGLVCTAGTRKKTEYKQLPRGYAEVLENTQFALIATVHKLYSMVRQQQTWDLGEPELNDRGQPVIHNIASKLGCIRPNSDIDLPVHSIFPEDQAGLAELERQLNEQQQKEAAATTTTTITSPPAHTAIKQEAESTSSIYARASSSPASDLDHSDLDLDFDIDHDYRRAAFCNGSTSAVTMSPSSLSYTGDFDLPPQSDSYQGYHQHQHAAFFPGTTTTTPPSTTTTTTTCSQQQAQQQQQTFLPSHGGHGHGMTRAAYLELNMDHLLGPRILMEQDFGGATIKPHVLSASGCPTTTTSEVMMGMGDPMIYAGVGVYEDGLRM